MRSTITVSIPEDAREELDRVATAEGVSRSDIVRESLRDYLSYDTGSAAPPRRALRRPAQPNPNPAPTLSPQAP